MFLIKKKIKECESMDSSNVFHCIRKIKVKNNENRIYSSFGKHELKIKSKIEANFNKKGGSKSKTPFF